LFLENAQPQLFVVIKSNSVTEQHNFYAAPERNKNQQYGIPCLQQS
jgi:hypothetical protein